MMTERENTTLVEHSLFGTEDIVDKALTEIRAMAKHKELCLRFSGGKDSIVMKRLMDMARVPYCARFSKTSVDPPELIDFVKRQHADVLIEDPRISMFHLIVKKGFPPTRICRYCCAEFKERNVCGRGDGVLTLTGVRKAESPRRKNRAKYETCQADKGVNFFHPIINWTDEQIWDFIEEERLPYCSLYNETGITRIGCVGCPLASSKKIESEFKRWPQFEKAYLWAFEKMLVGRSFDKWKTPYDVMDWYIYGAQKDCNAVVDELQLSIFDDDYFGQFDAGEDAPILAPADVRRVLEERGLSLHRTST